MNRKSIKKESDVLNRAERLMLLISESHWVSHWMIFTNYRYVVKELKEIINCDNNEKNRRIIGKSIFIYEHAKTWDDALVEISQMLISEGLA